MVRICRGSGMRPLQVQRVLTPWSSRDMASYSGSRSWRKLLETRWVCVELLTARCWRGFPPKGFLDVPRQPPPIACANTEDPEQVACTRLVLADLAHYPPAGLVRVGSAMSPISPVGFQLGSGLFIACKRVSHRNRDRESDRPYSGLLRGRLRGDDGLRQAPRALGQP